jgi:hypothetical protein
MGGPTSSIRYRHHSSWDLVITQAPLQRQSRDTVHREYMPIIIQRDATVYSLYMSVNCSACFGWYLHPSSGAHATVSTVTANFRGRDWMGTGVHEKLQLGSYYCQMLWIQ